MAMKEKVVEKFETIDILINNAGAFVLGDYQNIPEKSL